MSVDEDLISVVIPTHNRSGRLQEAITSVQAQSWRNLEVILVDDASTDATANVVRQIAELDSRIRYLRNETPLGGGGARNVGIAAARGRYVAFLDDDDQWMPEKLVVQHAAMNAYKNASAISCSFLISSPGRANKIKTIYPPDDLQQLLRANSLGGASVCFTTRDLLHSIGGFDPLLRSGQDWDLWLKLYAIGEIVVCEQPLVCYVIHRDDRITGSYQAAYRGRRKIYMRYRSLMDGYTKRFSLCELCFLRWIIFRRSRLQRIQGMCALLIISQGVNKLRFLYRFFKWHLQG